MNCAPYRPPARHVTASALALAVAALVSLFLLLPSAAHAQQGDVSISSVACDADPEVVSIFNGGADAVDLTGWQLESDPDESFDLSPIQTLAASASVTIEAGPAASGTFVWSTTAVLRDNDSTDYVRIVDNTGATMDEKSCAAAPEPSPTPGDVPNGGGPPAPASGPSTVFVFAGAGLSTVALTGLAFAFLPLGRAFSRIAGGFWSDRRAEGPVPAASSARTPGASGISLALGLAIALALVLLITFTLKSRQDG